MALNNSDLAAIARGVAPAVDAHMKKALAPVIERIDELEAELKAALEAYDEAQGNTRESNVR